MRRLLIVSNRLPVTAKSEHGEVRVVPSSGGLASAMRGPHDRFGGLWFGSAGDISRATPAEQGEIRKTLAALRAVPIPISAAEIARYYDGFSNGVLWPLFHYLLDNVRLDADRDWTAYRAVNERFAEHVASAYQEGDSIWIHDYHLALVPAMLRDLLPRAKIGFFLHVPFPSADVFRILPWREEIVRGMLGADLVGFHTASYRHNFSHAAAHLLDLDLGIDAVTFEDRTIKLGVFPIGIDTSYFERLADDPAVLAETARIREATKGKTIILGVDRLDYTKGIRRRILAVDRLLEREPALRDKVHMIQVAVPSREKVDAYAALRRQVNELVSEVNSQHGSTTSAPVQFLYRSVSPTQLVALYRAADVMLVTPLRDGMNLVAKEYVASRTDCGGVLVLSEFAGAATELDEALLVNPYDVTAVASAIKRAMTMRQPERELRMRGMRAWIKTHDVHSWAQKFLADLEHTGDDRAPMASVQPVTHGPGASEQARALAARVDAARDAASRILLLDYDGTLVSIAPLPELAVPDAALIDMLERLAALDSMSVHVLSGRGRASLGELLGDLPIGLHAEHGLVSRAPDGTWVANREAALGWQERVLPILEAVAERTPGSFVERKPTSCAFHYRMADPHLVVDRLRQLRETLRSVVGPEEAELLEGHRVLEIRPRGVNKGVVARRLLDEMPASTIIAAGDDRTDEDTFAALPEEAITIRVGPGTTRAHHRVDDPAALRRLLAMLLE